MKKASGKLHRFFQLFDPRMSHQSSIPVACTEIVRRCAKWALKRGHNSVTLDAPEPRITAISCSGKPARNLIWTAKFQIFVPNALSLPGMARERVTRECFPYRQHDWLRLKLRAPRASRGRSDPHRGVAQPGRALPSGGRGRRFESSHPDQSFQLVKANLPQPISLST